MSDATVITNAAWSETAPRLSVVTPFFRHDPRPLLAAIDRQARVCGASVELIAIDDGSGDEALAADVEAHVSGLATAACLVRFRTNQGRAAARNRLTQVSRAPFILFMDADVTPARDDFLRTYLEAMAEPDAAMVVGGFIVPPATRPEEKLYRYMADTFDCLAADARQKLAWKYVYTCNILVRRDIAIAAPFDETYRGWGWEDMEFGMRVAGSWPIRHIENRVVHNGLETNQGFVDKITGSAGNFARVAAAHPRLIQTFPCHGMARRFRPLPGQALARAITRWLALANLAPLPIRGMALRVYRALIYARVVDRPPPADPAPAPR